MAPHSAAVGELTDALAKRGFDEAHRKEVEDTLNGILLQHASRSEAARSRMRREGVRGASEDHSRVLANEFLSNQMRLGYLEHGLSRSQALEAMRREVDEHEHPNAAPGAAIVARSVLAEAQKRTMPVEAHDSAFQRLGAKANSFSYAQSLMSFSHMLTSSMEAHTNSVALLSARHGPIKASLRLVRALAGAAPVLKEGAVNTFKAVGNQLKATDWNLSHVIRDRYLAQKGADRAGITQLFKQLEDAGLIDHTVLQDLRRQANPSGRIGSAAGDVWQRFTNFMAAGGHAVDVMNKAAIAKAAYDLEFAKIHDRSKAIEYAVETARRVMPNYNLGNKARIATNRGPLGAVGSPLFQFKNYGLHMYSLLANLARDSMGGPNAKEARYAFANLLATHAMMAGVLTLIADPLRYVMGAYDFATGAKQPHNYQNDLRQGIASIFGPELGEWISRGIPHMLGGDVHRRVGLANLLEVPEMSTFDKKGMEDVLVGLATGATGENLAAIVDGLNKTLAGDPTSGIKALLPRPARDVMKAIDLGARGVVDSQGKTILPPEKLSTRDLVFQGLGFQPSQVSEFREGRNAVLEAREEAQAEHTRLTNRWLAADPGERQNVMQEIRLFNQDPKNLGFRITVSQLLRDAQQRRKQANAPFGLRLPRKGADALAEAGAFANVQ